MEEEKMWRKKVEEKKPKTECRRYSVKYVKNLRTQKVYVVGNKVLFHRMKLIKNLTRTNWATIIIIIATTTTAIVARCLHAHYRSNPSNEPRTVIVVCDTHTRNFIK